MSKKSRKNVGLIGLGIIGSQIANALRLGGFHVYVWNRTPRAAPNFLGSPRQVAELCDVIQLFVADAQAVFDVLDGMGDALTPSHTIVCSATIGPEAVLEAARMVQQRGAQFLDAPFTGSKAAAQNRELVYFIGGDDKTFQAAEPILEASSKAIVRIGKIGDAATIKVATNMIAAVTVQSLAEAYAIVKASGIDPRTLGDALKHHAARSGLSDVKLAKILDRDYEPHFSLKHMFKDVQLGIHIANSLDIDLPATTAAAGVMYGGLTKGWADQDFAVLARSYQKDAPPAPLPTAPGEKAPSADPAASAKPAAAPAQDKPQDAPPVATPIIEKKEPPRESTPEELRNVGIKLPDAPGQSVSAKPPPSEPKPDNASTGAPKTDSPKAGQPAPNEPAKPEASPEKPGASPDKGNAETVAGPAGGSGTPEEPAREHTSFVRIRRWFGTGPTT